MHSDVEIAQFDPASGELKKYRNSSRTLKAHLGAPPLLMDFQR